MVLLTCAALAILFSLSSQEILSSVQADLREQVQESVDELESEEGRLRVDADFYSMENGGLPVCVQYGRRVPVRPGPGRFSPGKPAFENDSLRTVQDRSQRFYVFDLEQKVEGYGDVWIRGTASVTRAENELHRHAAVCPRGPSFPCWLRS